MLSKETTIINIAINVTQRLRARFAEILLGMAAAPMEINASLPTALRN
jgi:hypothetical protein